MAYDLTGTIIAIFDEQQITEKFRKQEFVVEVPGQYPESIKLQLTNDKIDLIAPYAVGSAVKVSFNLRGKGFNKNGQMLYFTNLEAWKIEATGNSPAPSASTSARTTASPSTTGRPAPIVSDDDNDLPF